MLCWSSCNTREIEQTRLRRRVRRLEQRLASLRGYQMAAAHSDAIVVLEAELARLRGQADGV